MSLPRLLVAFRAMFSRALVTGFPLLAKGIPFAFTSFLDLFCRWFLVEGCVLKLGIFFYILWYNISSDRMAQCVKVLHASQAT